MDNQRGKKLPSAVLPTVSGDEYVITETPDGAIWFVDSSGAKRLMTVDEEYEVDDIVFRANDVSPASKHGGTWTKIAQGRVIIGASDAFPLNSEGGEAMHTLTVAEMPSHSHTFSPGGTAGLINGATGGTGWLATSTSYETTTSGNSQPHNNMQPYLALNIWKRVA